MRKVQAAIAVAFAVGLVQGPARAQSAAQHEANRHYKPQPLNLRKEQELGTAAFASDARKRMAAGDCEGALTSFDAALRTSTRIRRSTATGGSATRSSATRFPRSTTTAST